MLFERLLDRKDLLVFFKLFVFLKITITQKPCFHNVSKRSSLLVASIHCIFNLIFCQKRLNFPYKGIKPAFSLGP